MEKLPGKAPAYVCRECELVTPLRRCPECGEGTDPLRVTPPAELRPVGPGYLEFIREVLVEEGLPADLVRDDELLLANRAPDLDYLDEIVAAEPVLALRYDLREDRWTIVLKPEGARRLHELGGKSIEVDRGAAEAVREGKNLFAPGVTSADDVEPGEWVVIEHGDRPVAFGRARMSGDEMIRRNRGLAVEVRGAVEGSPTYFRDRDFEDVARAHEEYVSERLEEAVEFTRKNVSPSRTFASFSGGKDSLVTLVVAAEAGVERALFVDTGMELPETVEAADRAAEAVGVDVEIVEGDPEMFHRVTEALLPPSRDNRWCTLAAKLAPVTRYVRSEFGRGCYTLVGVRRYESETRSERGRVWDSDAVPGQVNVAPIFDWSSLDVWLCVYSEDLPYNPLYDEGFGRIGCYMCPASKVGDFRLSERVHPELWEEWMETLERYRERHGLSRDWLRYHVWRWLRPEGEIRKVVSEESLRWGERVLGRWREVPPEEAARGFRRECPGCGYCGAVGSNRCEILEVSLRRVFGR
ncbi:phosphoadenosine phosphosulfate reductase domain-containing protein [Methanopyrus kandleri]